jgi:methionyl-tRNA formyltransferase
MPSAKVHNLVRAVAPPYPGAFCTVNGRQLRILGTFCDRPRGPASPASPAMLLEHGQLRLRCADGGTLLVTAAELDSQPLTPENFALHAGSDTLLLT